MISTINASDAEGHTISIEYFYLENLFFDDKLDFTLGKLDPLFLTTFTSYCGWDRYNFFSKTASSDPVPPIDPGFGFFLEYNAIEYFSIGGMITDANSNSDFIDPVSFFDDNPRYAFTAFSRFSFPSKKDLYSEHKLAVYYQQAGDSDDEGDGTYFTYVGNQGITEKLVLIFKASYGNQNVAKLNEAYAAGIVIEGPFRRHGDLLGTSVLLNKKTSYKYEPGIDVFYKFFIRPWCSISANIQAYINFNGDRFGQENGITLVPGARLFFGY